MSVLYQLKFLDIVSEMITQEDKDKFRKKMAYGDCNHPEPTSRKRVPRSDGPDEDTTDEFDEGKIFWKMFAVRIILQLTNFILFEQMTVPSTNFRKVHV